MANLKEKAEWTEGVYQLEPSDPVMGGENGIDNLQAKQLANRTLYLKAAIETQASTTTRGRVSLSSSTNSKSETEAATPLAVKTTYDLATGANNAANTALSIANTAKSDASTALNIANTAKSDASTALNIANTAKSDANIAKNTANTANNRANTAYNTAMNAFPKTGGKIEGSVDATGGFYQKGNKLIMQGEYGVGHQNLSLTKISDNLNEQNASFFGSTYANMPESIKPYIKDGSGVVGVVLPYRASDKGWHFSSRLVAEVGTEPANIFYQEYSNDVWQKPAQLITDQNIKNHIGEAYIIETYKSEDGSSWYRKWSDGFVEQGGVKHGTFNAHTVHNLVIPFSSDKYVILVNTLALDDTVSTTSAAKEKQHATFKCEASRAQGYNYTYTTITFLAYGYQ